MIINFIHCSIGSLINLKDIQLYGNKQLHTLSIGDLKCLKKLNLHDCGLTMIPERSV